MPRGARLEPSRRHRGRPHGDARCRRRGARDRHLPGQPPEAGRVGPRRAHARDQPQGRADRPQGGGPRTRFVAGSIGPTGMLPSSDDPTLCDITFAELSTSSSEQARGLVEGGADLIIIETAQDILELKAAVSGAREAFKTAGKTPDPGARSCSTPTAADAPRHRHRGRPRRRSRRCRVDLIGLNCSTGPEHMREPIRFLGENSRCRSASSPTLASRSTSDDKTVFPAGRSRHGRRARRVRDRLRGQRPSAAAAAPRRSTSLRSSSAVGSARRQTSARPRRLPRVSSGCARSAAGPGTRAAARRRAGQRDGHPQGQAPAAGGRLRRHPRSRAGAVGGRRPPPRHLRRDDRAPTRSSRCARSSRSSRWDSSRR